MKYEKALEKIKWCKIDVEEFKDLIEINDTSIEFLKRYELCKFIIGAKIKNRIENLIVACWSAKDWIKKDITSLIDSDVAYIFEKNIFEVDNTHLIQYLANSIKHCGIDDKKMNGNKYKDFAPTLEKTVLKLSNQSFPGDLKPSVFYEDYDVPPFQVSSYAGIDGKLYYNFDTIDLSIKIVDKNGKYISDAIKVVMEYVDLIKKEFNRLTRV
jgi:hypothetical protein